MGHADQRLRELELERTLLPQDAARPRGLTIAAALRLAHALKPVSRDRVLHLMRAQPLHAPRAIHVNEREAPALWSPLSELDPNDETFCRVTSYCEYTRVLITVAGVASALRLTERAARDALSKLRHGGKLVPVRRIQNERATATRVVWEWVDAP